MLKKWVCTVLTAALLFTGAVPELRAATFVPYQGYEYNTEEESVPAPVGYEPTAMRIGTEMGSGALSAPTDMGEYNGELYILDAGNSRIVVTDAALNCRRIIGKPQYNGQELDYTDAGGLYVCKNGDLLIADTAGQRILQLDNAGNCTGILTRPDTPMIASTLEYRVKKVIRDDNGVTYALVDGLNEGVVTYLSNGSFGGFFAMNEVEKTAQALLNYVWRKFMTEEQIRNSATSSPSSITNFGVADKGFIYTVTQSTDGETGVRLLNFKGSNLQDGVVYGDLEWDRKIKDSVSTAFCDVEVDSEGFVLLLDASRCRVFVYSKDGDLITVCGGKGDQLGTFASVTALETVGDTVYVLDGTRGGVTVFRANEYVQTVRRAQTLLQSGQYGESKVYWERVLQLNANSTIAYYGIGLALDEAGQYREALRYFRLAYSSKGYSAAFKEVRREFIKANFLWLLAVAAAVIVGLILLIRWLRRRFGRRNAYESSALEQKYTAPLFTMLHPMDGYDGLKKKRQWSMALSLGILAALFLTLTASWFLTGFSFNQNRASDYNLFITLLQAFGVIAVCTIANWAVCTLIEGKGRLVDIFCMIAYSLVPYILAELLCVVLSNTMTLEEDAFLTAVRLAGVLWSAVLIFVGSMSIHQFSFAKNVLSFILTAVGVAIILFLAILFVGLMQQVVSFIQAIWSEAAIMT